MTCPARSIADPARHEAEIGIDHQLRAEGAGAELRSREVQVVVLLELVIGKLIAGCHADAAGTPGRIDEVHAGDLRLFSAVFRVSRYEQALGVGAQHGAVAFVKPFGRHAAAVGFGPAALEARAKHPHAVGEVLRLRLLMHAVAVRGAAEMRQPCAAHKASRRLGMIDGHEQAPRRRSSVDRIVLERFRRCVHDRRARATRHRRRSPSRREPAPSRRRRAGAATALRRERRGASSRAAAERAASLIAT